MTRWRHASLWLCSPPLPAKMGGVSGYINGQSSRISDFFSSSTKTFLCWLFADARIRRWNASSIRISSSSSSPLLSLVTNTSEISHPPVHTYTTYIWQRGRQNRKTGYVRKIQHLHEEREEEKKMFTPRLCSIGEYSVRTEKKHLSTKAHIP